MDLFIFVMWGRKQEGMPEAWIFPVDLRNAIGYASILT